MAWATILNVLQFKTAMQKRCSMCIYRECRPQCTRGTATGLALFG
jgi:hypothetical protein